jgi:cytochrome P450
VSDARYDPYDRESRRDPYPAFAQLREHCPVHHHTVPSVEVQRTNSNPIVARPTTDFYSVARYADVVAVLQDSKTFASGQGPGPERLVAQDGIGMLIYADEPHHTRQRRIVVSAFQPKVINPMRPAIEAICERLLDEVGGVGTEGGTAELVGAYVEPVPIETIALVLGVSAEDRDRFKKWSDDTLLAFGGDLAAYERSYRSLVEFQEYFTDVITSRRRALARGGRLPDDVLTHLIDAEYEERQFSDEELVMALQILLLGAVDTTNHAIGNGIHLLLTHPDARALLDRDPQRWATAVEEILRFEAPAQALFRATTVDTTVAGVLLPSDAKVRVLFAAANRDPATFTDPDEFRVDRSPGEVRRHMSFGRGAHACLGAALGRAMLEISLRTLFRRLPGLRLDPDRPAVRDLDRFHTRTWASLPVRWDAG